MGIPDYPVSQKEPFVDGTMIAHTQILVQTSLTAGSQFIDR